MSVDHHDGDSEGDDGHGHDVDHDHGDEHVEEEKVQLCNYDIWWC